VDSRAHGYPKSTDSEDRTPTNLTRVEWRRRILVVEDEPLIASLIADSLTREGFDVAIAHDALQAREQVQATDPDAALIDINLGSGPNGMHFGQWLHRTHPYVALVFLSRHVDPRTAGIEQWDVPPGSSFLAKDRMTEPRALVQAIDFALRQSPSTTRHDLETTSKLAKLTTTQIEILRLAAQGLTNTAIAERRGTSERTVEQRLQAVYESLGIEISRDVNARVQAIRMFIEAGGLIKDPQPLP
jgi:DNA-binding NarL/FixJ family response regulator